MSTKAYGEIPCWNSSSPFGMWGYSIWGCVVKYRTHSYALAKPPLILHRLISLLSPYSVMKKSVRKSDSSSSSSSCACICSLQALERSQATWRRRPQVLQARICTEPRRSHPRVCTWFSAMWPPCPAARPPPLASSGNSTWSWWPSNARSAHGLVQLQTLTF